MKSRINQRAMWLFDRARGYISRADRGHVLTLMALFAFALACFVMLIINTGELLTKKVVVQSAADSASYTMAAWDARGLNLVAMMNVFEVMLIALVAILKAFADIVYLVWLAALLLVVGSCVPNPLTSACADACAELKAAADANTSAQRALREARTTASTLVDVATAFAFTSGFSYHATGYAESSINVLTDVVDGGGIVRANGAHFGGVAGPGIVELNGLPVCTPSACVPEGDRIAVMTSEALYGRLGGYDVAYGITDAFGLLFGEVDPGKAAEILSQTEGEMQPKIDAVRVDMGGFHGEKTGPFYSDLSRTGTVILLTELLSKAPKSTSAALFVAWAANGYALELPPLNPSAVPESVVGENGPLLLARDWEGDLQFLGVAGRRDAQAPLLPALFKYDGDTLYAVSMAEAYNPFHEHGQAPDMFTPQWRARLIPVRKDAGWYAGAGLDGAWAGLGLSIEELATLVSLIEFGAVQH